MVDGVQIAACMRKITYMSFSFNFLEEEYLNGLIHKPKNGFEILKATNQRVVKWDVSAQFKRRLLKLMWSSSTVSNTIITTDSRLRVLL